VFNLKYTNQYCTICFVYSVCTCWLFSTLWCYRIHFWHSSRWI